MWRGPGLTCASRPVRRHNSFLDVSYSSSTMKFAAAFALACATSTSAFAPASPAGNVSVGRGCGRTRRERRPAAPACLLPCRLWAVGFVGRALRSVPQPSKYRWPDAAGGSLAAGYSSPRSCVSRAASVGRGSRPSLRAISLAPAAGRGGGGGPTRDEAEAAARGAGGVASRAGEDPKRAEGGVSPRADGESFNGRLGQALPTVDHIRAVSRALHGARDWCLMEF